MNAGLLREGRIESEPRIAVARREAALRRQSFDDGPGNEARGLLIDALVALAGESAAIEDDTAASAALGEAEFLFPARRSGESEWRGRSVILQRAKAAHAQRQNRHADAVKAFESALAEIPAEISRAGRDGNAARLQLLVQLARSRLALGQAAKAVADMRRAETIMAALDGALPSRAIETVRAAVLANTAVGLSMLGKLEEAEASFAASASVIDRLGTAELAGLRTQVLDAWAGMLRKAGRPADAKAMLVAFGTQSSHAHSDACGCGHDHAHHHDLSRHDHGESHHDHDQNRGCASHPH